MLIHTVLIAASVASTTVACQTVGGELSTPAAQDRATTSEKTDVDDAKKNPVQLAQYPGTPYEDRNGTLWFSTVLKGLIRYDGEEYTTFTTADGLPSNMVRDLVEDDDGTLWIGTNRGVTLYDGESFNVLTDYGDLQVTRTFQEEGDHRDIWDIHKDRAGNWWIATLDGVFRYNGKKFTPFAMPAVAKRGAYEFAPKMVYSIFEAQDGALWFGTDGAGAVRYDGTDMVVYTEAANGLASDRVCKILEDSRGLFWFGTSTGGVSRFDGKEFTTHLRSETHSIHTGWGRYFAVYEDKHGHVWFGRSSAGGGVHRFDGEHFRYFSVEDGLGTGGVPSIREDRKGNLWFGTTAGVYLFDGKRFVSFTEKK